MVTAASIRTGVFTALRTLLNANKPTYTYDSATQTYTVYSQYQEDNPTLPCLVINPSNIAVELITLDGTGSEYLIEVQIDFYARGKHGLNAIDSGRDSVTNTIISNLATLDSTYNLLLREDAFDDSTVGTFMDKVQLINTASSIIRMKLE